MTVPIASQSQLIEALLTLAAVPPSSDTSRHRDSDLPFAAYRTSASFDAGLHLHVVPHVFEFLVYFVPGFLHADKIRLGYFRPIWWMQSLDQSSLILFLLFMIWALRAFTTKGNQQ